MTMAPESRKTASADTWAAKAAAAWTGFRSHEGERATTAITPSPSTHSSPSSNEPCSRGAVYEEALKALDEGQSSLSSSKALSRLSADFLQAIHSDFNSMPRDLMRDASLFTLEKGRGRVGRDDKKPQGERVELAVQAMVRHELTNYETILRELDNKVSDPEKRKNVARECIRPEVYRIMGKWAEQPTRVDDAREYARGTLDEHLESDSFTSETSTLPVSINEGLGKSMFRLVIDISRRSGSNSKNMMRSLPSSSKRSSVVGTVVCVLSRALFSLLSGY